MNILVKINQIFFQSLLSIHLPAAPSTRESRALIHVYYVSQVVHTIFSVEIIIQILGQNW